MEQLVILIAVISFFWLAVLTFYLYKISIRYLRLVKGTKNQDWMEVIDGILNHLGDNQKNIEELKKKIQELADNGVTHIQKVGVLRFNPFADTGGDQSFILTILDGNDTGFVLTSLHNRGVTRWYAKNVKEGKGVDHQLSEEERKAIKQAFLVKSKK
ncbi:DUF4446 family protein [Candidatus Gottesmanbacteria bacterium]|nr:DUF4446 family protein [Candidatus Gottesmanbacteria bacterium]